MKSTTIENRFVDFFARNRSAISLPTFSAVAQLAARLPPEPNDFSVVAAETTVRPHRRPPPGRKHVCPKNKHKAADVPMFPKPCAEFVDGSGRELLFD
jgi:hypothetical protein